MLPSYVLRLFVALCLFWGSASTGRVFAGWDIDVAETGVVYTERGEGKLTSDVLQQQPDELPGSNHIRVRYKAAYCECVLGGVYAIPFFVFYASPRSYATLVFQLVTRHNLSSRLRGPPSLFC